MILIDNNQVIIANLFSLLKHNNELDENLLRHMILNTYRMYRKKFHNKYGELVICNDSRSWRKDIFENYKSKYSILADRLPKQEYLEKLWKSKLALSPFGQGEICYRDFEAMQFGTLLVKPDQSKITTFPNPYIENETYIVASENDVLGIIKK